MYLSGKLIVSFVMTVQGGLYCGNNPVMYYNPDGYAVNGIGICTKTDQTEYGEQVSVARVVVTLKRQIFM